jgi:hypothetical protein
VARSDLKNYHSFLLVDFPSQAIIRGEETILFRQCGLTSVHKTWRDYEPHHCPPLQYEDSGKILNLKIHHAMYYAFC